MNYYINCLKEFPTLRSGIKELVPDMNLRRRMSKLVKMAVCTGIESLNDFEGQGSIDAIVTATGIGCIADSEKFLANLLDSKEQMLNPTPFIQSTFNTVGAQIAVIKSLHVYNNTFTHRYTSFESALVDAMLQLTVHYSKAVLVGVFDEATPTVETVMKRMGLLKDKPLGEGAIFFVLTKEQLPTSVALIEELSFLPKKEDGRFVSSENKQVWCGAVAQVMAHSIASNKGGYIVNDLGGKCNSYIKLRCL
ncbi:MAG: beta-ketoacyl synthase chain length factor [Phocaeicola sp.]